MAMDKYERNVRSLLKTLDMFFESHGKNAEELEQRVRWLNAYHEQLDKERTDRAEQLQRKLF